MNIEQKMDYIRKALELGADVELRFHDISDEKEAEKVATELSEILSIPFQEKSNNGTHWFKIKADDYSLETTVFYEKEYLEEDVILDGMGGEERVS